VPHSRERVGHSDGWATTAQTTLAWRWIQPDGAVVGGELTWPDSYRPSETYAASLLRVAEEAFEERCAQRPLPPATVTPRELAGPDPGDAPNTSDRDPRDGLERALATAGEDWKRLPPCTGDP